MSVAALSRVPLARFAQLSDVRTTHLLGGIVVLSFLGRLFASWSRATPTFFPDEYLYAELARSIADGGSPLVRGVASGFPSLLHPLVTSPFWLIDDVETAFRAVQALDAGLMSLAALPAFAIARQLSLSRNLSLAVAASALLVPDLLLSGWLVAEPLAYPLVLSSVWATVRALEHPSISNQSLLLVLLGLTTLSRFQLAVVPLAVLATLVLVGARERCLIRTMREQWLVVSVGVGAVILGAVLLAAGKLGTYSGAVHVGVDPIGVAVWAAPTALLVAYAAGWLIVPGALMGLWVGIARPRAHAEGVTSILTVVLALGLLAQAGFVSDTITQDLHERYVFYLSPLLFAHFGVWLARKAPGRRVYAAVAIGLGLAALVVPLSRYSAADGKTDSAFLRALGGLEDALGNVGAASALVAGASIIGCVLALLAYRAGTRGLRALLVGGRLVGATSSALAASFDHGNALRVEREFAGSSPAWIDSLDVREAPLLWAKNGRAAVAHETLFWNRSVNRVVLLPGAKPFDNYATTAGSIDEDGRLLDGDEPLSGWVLVDGYASSLSFVDGVPLGDVEGLTLYRFDTTPRLSTAFEGRYFDGWLHPIGQLSVWPSGQDAHVSGRVALTVEAPADGPDRTLTLSTPELTATQQPATDLRVTIPAGEERTITIDACTVAGPWHLDYAATPVNGDTERTVTVRASALGYEPTPLAERTSCESASS